VLGRKSLRDLLNWRRILRKKLIDANATPATELDENDVDDEKTASDKEDDDIQKEIAELTAEEKRVVKRFVVVFVVVV
jgi:hypothetical protein